MRRHRKLSGTLLRPDVPRPQSEGEKTAEIGAASEKPHPREASVEPPFRGRRKLRQRPDDGEFPEEQQLRRKIESSRSSPRGTLRNSAQSANE